MSKPSIIVDIDNTLISQNIRKTVILSHLLNKEIKVEDVIQDFWCNNIFQDHQRDENLSDEEINSLMEEFSNKLTGSNYYDINDLYIIPHSKDVLIELNKQVDIIYLSSRHKVMYNSTIEQLEHFGFPKVDGENNILVLNDSTIQVKSDKFLSNSAVFKEESIRKLSILRNIILGIGDTVEDIIAYNNCGCFAVLISEYFNSNDLENVIDDPFSYIELESWIEIKHLIFNYLGSSNELEELCHRDIDQYSKWLYDMDNKAYLLLIVGTFCATTLYSSINTNSSLPFIILTIVGIFTSVCSIVFSIRAFGSRSTSGQRASNELNLTHGYRRSKSIFTVFRLFFLNINYFISIIFGIRKNPYSGPIADKRKVHQSKFSKFSYIKYYKDTYKTIIPKEVNSLKLYDIKSTIYSKIMPEVYARKFVFATLIIIILLSFLTVADKFLNLP